MKPGKNLRFSVVNSVRHSIKHSVSSESSKSVSNFVFNSVFWDNRIVYDVRSSVHVSIHMSLHNPQMISFWYGPTLNFVDSIKARIFAIFTPSFLWPHS